MASILGLFIHCGIPISIIEDNIASTSQIQPYPTRSCARNETQYFGIVIESFNNGLSKFSLGIPIQTNIIKLEHVENFFKDIQHFCHLCEN